MKTNILYKDSNIEWLGKIPSHWNLVPLKRLVRIKNGKDYKEYLDSEDYPVIGSGGIFTFCSQYLYDGEALLLGRKGTVDKPLYVNGKFWTVDTMFYAIPKVVVNVKYLYYQALTIPFERYMTSTALPSMTQTDLGNHVFCVPTLIEQEAIVAYLDKKCNRIDSLIEKLRQEICLLNEIRQTTIADAVTQGINKNRKFVESGIDWIGRVPEKWKKCRFKDFLLLQNQKSNSCNKIGLENIEGKTGKFIDTDTEYEGDGILFDCGDIVYGKLRPYLQKVWLSSFRGNAVGDFFVFKTKENCYNKYIHYLMLSEGFTSVCNGSTNGAKMPRVSSAFILSLNYYLPPLKEQYDIVTYLDLYCQKNDLVVSDCKSKISLLEELKKSIIKESVTGKTTC